ncbi:MAG TPA: hypothetical protein VLA33_05820 [Gemmatimonadota bacterium]|nr:hypothetical protein [Gemmatimonadota bacterium]
MAKTTPNLLKKLLFRYDGAADSAKVKFTSAQGNEWEAELSLHSGTGPQAPRLMVLFRRPRYPNVPQRYTLLPPRFSKIPDEAAEQVTEGDLRELLAMSVQV